MPEPTTPVVDVILPCLDEVRSLPYLLGRLPDGYRAIVVDNGSTDGSAALAGDLGAVVVSEPRRGYGAAVCAGVRAATADIVAVMDCDGSFSPAQLPAMVDGVAAGVVDLACGRRRPTTAASWPWHARAGNALIAAYLRRVVGLAVRDIAPIRVCRRTALLELDVRDRRSGYPLELLLLAARAGWRIREYDVDYARRTAGTRSKVSGSVRGTAVAIHDFSQVLAGASR